MRATVGHYKIIFCVPSWELEKDDDAWLNRVKCEKLNELLYEVKEDLVEAFNNLLAIDFALHDSAPYSNSHMSLELVMRPVFIAESDMHEEDFLKDRFSYDFNDRVKMKLEAMEGYESYNYDQGAVNGYVGIVQSADASR